jgi:hypothetical protein
MCLRRLISSRPAILAFVRLALLAAVLGAQKSSATEPKSPPVFFSVDVHLTALNGQQVIFNMAAQQWVDVDDCRRHLPLIEQAVERLIRLDPAVLRLFGQTIGEPTRAHFIAYAQCDRNTAPSPQEIGP